MIARLTGQIVEKTLESAIVDVGGVGYEVACSSASLEQIGDVGERARLWVHTHVREDALQLFGFASELEKQMFLSLLKVNGIGPKMALKILSSTTFANLVDMIERGDVKGLSGLPKVGKKTAEQLILSLKGQLVLNEPTTLALPPRTRVRDEIVSALVNLGFRLQDVEKVVAELPEDTDMQQGLRRGLQALSGAF